MPHVCQFFRLGCLRLRSEEMAYAALISLEQTIKRLGRNSCHVSITEMLASAYLEACKLQRAVDRLESSSGKNSQRPGRSHLHGGPPGPHPPAPSPGFAADQRRIALAVHIREAVCKLEDVLESDVSCGFLSGSEMDECEVRSEINSFIQMSKKAIEQCEDLSKEEDGDEEDVVLRIDSVHQKGLEIVGLEDEYDRVLKELFQYHSSRRVLSLVGMAGIGKTTLAVKALEDSKILKRFDFCAFVTVGLNCTPRRIMLSILRQLGYDIDHLSNKSYSNVAMEVYRHLCRRRYLIVLDDVWSAQLWDLLKQFLPVDKSGGRVLVTTRLEDVALSVANWVHRMRFLCKEESWNLLCLQVFGRDGLCPFSLKKAGMKIADLCEGLPLAVVTVSSLLSKAEKTEEYWMKVAERKNSVFTDAEDLMFEVLIPSFENLPSYLRPCFLYIGIFMPKYEIHSTKLIDLWSAEGLLEPDPRKTPEDFSMECLEILVSKSLVMLSEASSIGRIKTCSLHFTFRSLSVKVARTNKFFHVINSYASSHGEGIENQRQFIVHNNTVFRIKDIHSSMESITTVRSLLCTGPYHPYMVPMCFRLRLLRVLDVVTIRFYKFPKEVLKLIQLKYLAFTCNEKLPGLISKLCNLQYLIVCRSHNIKNCSARMRLPVEIWDMKELKHIHFAGGVMPEPVSEDSSLLNLSSFSGISAYSCTPGILARTPNVKKLGLQIELAADATDFMHCFEHLSYLRQLKSLKYIIKHPKLRPHVVPMPRHADSIFLPCLKKLNLSGFGYPFEALDTIGLLPNLQVLKLRSYACHGPMWEVVGGKFLELRYLQIEDTDLKQWRVEKGSFPRLRHLIIRHCYRLEMIPKEVFMSVKEIEFVDCNLLAVGSMISLKRDSHFPDLELQIRYSLERKEW